VKKYNLIIKAEANQEIIDATPMVELTFENGHLIFILFANFG